MKIYTNGAWRTVASARIYVNGAWRTITRASVYRSGAWRNALTLTSPVSVTTPGDVLAYVFGPGFTTGSQTVTATPSGGTSPYSYSWSITGTSQPVTPTLSNSTLATVTVNGGEFPNSSSDVQLSVTVTDVLGRTATGTASVTFQNTYLEGY